MGLGKRTPPACRYKPPDSLRSLIQIRSLLLSLVIVIDCARAQDSLPSKTIVVFNNAVPDSIALAKFYAHKRGIADDHLVGLDCPDEEEISREQYDETIAKPLRKIFQDQRWWQERETSDGARRVLASAIHFVALIKGVPLKIAATASLYPGDNPGPGPVQSRNEASVDSELSSLALFTRQISGTVTNPYFQDSRPIGEFGDAPLLLVSRLDAPDGAIVRRMITDAIDAERSGLWGRAFVDGAHVTSRGFEVGDGWMSAIVDQLHKAGIPVVYEDTPAIFPDAFPISDCALYYGWYTGNITGPFNQPGFKFVPGAIAVHIHSYSAATLRDPNSGWAGPLLTRGATATVGNVYEPYLELTAHLDILNDRLLHGFTFAESVFMSSRVLSWMGVAIGDPLYRPYLTQLDSKSAPAKSMTEWRAYRDFAVKNNKLPAADFRIQARVAASRTGNASMLEDIGLMELRDGNFAAAIAGLEQARGAYSKRDDIMRCVLEECDALIKSGKSRRALDLARNVLRIVPESPASQLLRKIESDLAPKTPPPAPTR